MKNGERREQSTQAAKNRLQQNLTRRSLVMAENFETKKKKKKMEVLPKIKVDER